MKSEIVKLLLLGFGDDSLLAEVSCALSETLETCSIDYRGRSSPSEHKPCRSLSAIHNEAWTSRFRITADNNCKIWPAGLDVDSVKSVELTCDRVFIGGLSSSDQVLYLSALLNLLEVELENVGPINAAIFSTTPHFPWDLIIDSILRSKKIRTFSIRGTGLDNRVVIVRHPFSTHSVNFVPRQLDERDSPFRNSSDFKKVPSYRLYLSEKLNSELPSSDYLNLIKGALKIVENGTKREVARLLFFFRTRSSSFRRTFHARSGDYWSIYSNPRIIWFGLRRLAEIHRCQREIRNLRLGSAPKRYVIFFLHFQPERSTDPECGHWRYQHRAISVLRRLLDQSGYSDLPIVIKEHPRQLLGNQLDLRGLAVRTVDFYRAIAGFENCFFVRTGQSSAELIRNSCLTVTPNGSAAWESVQFGRPALTFARTWHSDCVSAPNIDKVLQGAVHLSSLLSMSEEEVWGHRNEFLAAETVTHTGALQMKMVRPGEDSNLIRSMAASLRRLAFSDEY